MESWRHAWRVGLEPLLSGHCLTVLREALLRDDPRLIQGTTVSPPSLPCCGDWPPETACGIGYLGWQAEGLATVEEVTEYFARVCAAMDARLGELAGCRHFLVWFDDTPRPEMRRLLLEEVDLALAARGPTAAPEQAA